MAAPPPNPNQYPYQNGTPLSPPHPNQYANQPHQGAPRPNLTSPNARPHPPPGQYQQHQRPYPGQPISPQQQPPYPGRPHPQHPQHPQHPPTQSPQHHPYPQNPNIRPTGPGPRPFARPPFPPQHQQHQQHQQNQFHPQQQGSELHVPADTPSPISSAGPATPNVGTPGVPTPSSTRRRLYPEQMGNAYNAQPEPQPVNQFNQTNPMEPQLFVPGAPAPAMPSTMQYPGQQPQAGGNYPQTHPDINSLAGQMGNMNLNAGAQMTPTIPLLNVKPSMNDVLVPPPQPKIPPGIALTQSEFLTCDPAQKRSTVNAFPATPALVKKAKLPLGLVIVPHKTLEEHEHVPIVTEIVRCRACRTYINPFVTFIQHTKWRCNVCHVQNDVPQSFDYDLISRQPIDRLQRPELNYSIVDYLAPTEYMVRPPQPPIYVFVIDVSYAANQNGMLAITAKTILENLDRIPNQDNRVKVAFITFDSSVHFYRLSGEASEPQMLVCPDLDEVYLPQPDDLLVNLADARPCIEAFLSRLGLMFNQTHNVSSALGPALHSAHKLLSAFGGKITLFQSTLPTLQSGDLTTREDAKLLGTPKESSLLLPANNFYKNFALDCSKVQICVDMFLFGNQYLDVATLSSAAKFTGGQMFYYPGFNQNRSEDVNKYSYELGQFLSNPIGLEAVLRVRCTRGIRANTYYGNFFLRSTDLIALPNVTPNHAYTVELALDEKIETSTVYFQTALLHTSCYGERRIRVMTMALPVTSSISELYQSVDQQALAAFIAKKAVDRAVNSKLDDAREAILYKCAELLYTFKTELTPANSGATTTLPIYANIALYPLLSLAMLKHISLRGGSSIGTDARTAAINLINILPADQLITYLLPKFYSLHDLSPEFGVADANGQVLLPQALPLRGEFIQPNGIYMLYNGQSILLYISHATDPDLLMNLFAVASYGALFGGKVTLPELDNSFNKQVHGIINKLRKQDRNTFYPEVYVVKEDGDPTLKLMLNTWLVEDRSNNVQDYNAFTLQLREKVNSEKF